MIKILFSIDFMANKLIYFFRNAALTILGCMSVVSCQEDVIPVTDYTVSGEDVSVSLNLILPEMDVKTRASIDEANLNRVSSLWIMTFSSVTGKRTMADWVKIVPETTDAEKPYPVTLNTKSGNSYIVGVANVDNLGVTKDNLNEPKPLSELLDAAQSWEDFLKIAVCTPSNYNDVYAPNPPLPMAGCFTNLVVGGDHTVYPHRVDDWQSENFKPVFIPASSTGSVTLTNGALHLRRLVSQVTFNLRPGSKVNITPTSYRIFNAPAFSWLYERENGDGELMTANFGDLCTEDTKDTYYKSPAQYPQNFFDAITGETGSYTFNFWQGENKHTGNATTYAERDAENKTVSGPVSNTDKYQDNTGIFTALSGEKWTSNNMASYVLITCNVIYKGNENGTIDVDPDGVEVEDENDGDPVFRSGVGYYLIHLGYMDQDASDFNCYRNTNYTYNVTVEGLNQIRVEAFHGDEYPGAEGFVTDVENETKELDCHYGSFNIQLTDQELAAWNNESKTGFGFIITTYENGVEHTYQESDFVDKTTQTADEEKYMNWVELRKTTGENVRAAYSPRGARDGETFNLFDASKGISDTQKSDNGWYTVFVNEYTYEAENANENVMVNRKPLWATYVNQSPRRFYIRVTRSISADGQSTYSRSKYAAVQQSIMTYYSTENASVAQNSTQQSGSAVGIERRNEVFGMNIRRSYTAAQDPTNGRYNTRQYATYRGGWDNVIQRNKFQYIPAGNTGVSAHTENIARLYGYTGSFTSDRGNAANGLDPQPNATTSNLTGTSDNNYYIEGINACMNRNRDNNGDGVIDNSEIRWYVPAMGKYLRMLIGNASLENPLMDYSTITQLLNGNGQYTNRGNAEVGRYLFFSSDGRILWAMEGFSTSNWNQYVDTPPWQVRCIRNLGIDLASEILTEDKTVPAYTYAPTNSNDINQGGIVTMSYYSLSSIRVNPLLGNGTGNGQMRCHVISNRTYNSLFEKFEISPGRYTRNVTVLNQDYTMKYDFEYTNNYSLVGLRNLINDNPCSVLDTDDKSGWRVPNIKEVAIMRNLGLLDALRYEYQNSTYACFAASCTFSTFNSNGINTNTLPAGNTLTNKILVSRFDGLTQTDAISSNSRPWFIRCVRDVE